MSEPDPNALAAALRQAADAEKHPEDRQALRAAAETVDTFAAEIAALIQSHLPQGEDTALEAVLEIARRWVKTHRYVPTAQVLDRETNLIGIGNEMADAVAAVDAARAPQRDEGNA